MPKVIVNLPDVQVEQIRKFASEYGFSLTDSLNRAISLYLFCVGAKSQGSNILIEDGDRQLFIVRFL